MKEAGSLFGSLASDLSVHSIQSDVLASSFYGEPGTSYPNLSSSEFDWPSLQLQTAFPPEYSLETLLKEPDSCLFSHPDIPELSENSYVGRELLEADRGINSSSTIQKTGNAFHGRVTKIMLLRRLSAQLEDALDRKRAGMPSCLAYLVDMAIGTTRGYILLFDFSRQLMKTILGDASDGQLFGPVTALAFSPDATRLVAGYAGGQIVIFDPTEFKKLHVIADAHVPGNCILQLKFLSFNSEVVFLDTSGSVFVLRWRKVVTISHKSELLFSGCQGEVCSLAPLVLIPPVTEGMLSKVSLIALGTFSQVVVINAKQDLQVLFNKKFLGPSNSLPLLSWTHPFNQSEDSGATVVPMLIAGRGSNIQIFKMVTHKLSYSFQSVCSLELDHQMISLGYLKKNIIFTVDTSECLHIIDYEDGEDIETADLFKVKLLYSSTYFRSVPTGGLVSDALSCASEFACVHSIVAFKGCILLLGIKSVHIVLLMKWDKRVKVLIDVKNYTQALHLANCFYTGQGKAVLGLPEFPEKRKEIVGKEISTILLEYLEHTLEEACPKTDNQTILSIYFKKPISELIQFAVAINRQDLLLGHAYEQLSRNVTAQQVFLEELETFINMDQITYLSPQVMKDFIDVFHRNNRLQDLQFCILHLNISSLDLHQMVKLCWTCCLYDAIIYIYTRVFEDYITPLEEFLRMLSKVLLPNHQQLLDSEQELGYKVLVYISCTFSGELYPIGRIPSHLVSKVKSEVFSYLTIKKLNDFGYGSITYPNIRILLYFNTKDFLNVLTMVFNYPEFHVVPVDKGSPQSWRRVMLLLLVDIVLRDSRLGASQVSMFYLFLARQITKFHDNALINPVLLDRVLEHLTTPLPTIADERQQALIELYQAGMIKPQLEEPLIAMCEKAGFYQVCEMLHEQRKDFQKLLACYYRDVTRKGLVFAYIDSVIDREMSTGIDRELLCSAVLACIEELLGIDEVNTAKRIFTHFPSTVKTIIRNLESNPESQYKFLKGSFLLRGKKRKQLTGEITEEALMQDRFIQLQARFQPDQVYATLQMLDRYCMKSIVKVLDGDAFLDSRAYIYECSGSLDQSCILLTQALDRDIKRLIEVEDGFVQNDKENSIATVNRTIDRTLAFLTRASAKLRVEESEVFWFRIIDLLMCRQSEPTISPWVDTVLRSITSRMFTSMMGRVSVPSLVMKLLEDKRSQSGKPTVTRELVLSMLEHFTFELTTLEIVNRIMIGEVIQQHNEFVRGRTKGFLLHRLTCCQCQASLGLMDYPPGKPISDAVLFGCGHLFHADCVDDDAASHDDPCPRCKPAVRCSSSFRRAAGGGGGRSFTQEDRRDFDLE